MSRVDEILEAAARGDRARVAALLDADPSLLTATTMVGSGAVHAAHYAGHSDVVELLVARGFLIDAFVEAELDRATQLRVRLDKSPELAQEFSGAGSTALHRACYWGAIDSARLLLDRGADVNAVTRDSFLQIRPLGCAVATPDVANPAANEDNVLALVDLLLERGADVNARRRDGMTALHSAAYRGHLHVIRRLLECGADPTLRAHEGGPHSNQTPAATARSQGQQAAAQLLQGTKD